METPAISGMNQKEALDHAMKEAVGLRGKIETLIKKNSSWWSVTEDDYDKAFGDAVWDLQQAIKEMTSSSRNPKVFTEKNNILVSRLEDAVRAGENLEQFYRGQKRDADLKSLFKFQSALKSSSRKIVEIDFVSLPDQPRTLSATTAPKNPPPTPSKTQRFWILKLNGEKWGIASFQIGHPAYFNAPLEDNTARASFKLVQNGDRILGYDYSRDTIAGIFDVTQELHTDTVLKDIIRMKLVVIFSPPILVTQISSDLSERLYGTNDLRLFSIEERQFTEISSLKGTDPGPDGFGIGSLSGVFSDDATASIQDKLDFKSDYEALAYALAYKHVKPPLAVGLFGNWGTGKSFFMNKLQGRIEQLAGSDNDYFCENIIPINFNSWHYSDTNLWASLITKIFEDLEKYGKGKPEKNVQKLFENLNSTRELLKETELKKVAVEKEIGQIKTRQLTLEDKIQENSKSLDNLNFRQVVGAMWKESQSMEVVKEIKTRVDLKDKDFNEIVSNFGTLKSGFVKVFKIFKVAYFSKSKNLFLALISLLAILGGAAYVLTRVDDINSVVEKIWGYVSILSGLLTQLTFLLRPAFKKIDSVYADLQDLAKQAFAKEKIYLEGKLQTSTNSLNDLREQEQVLKAKKTQLSLDISDITSGKRIIKFIENRASDARYKDSLGLISWVRKDFEDLDFLLKEQHTAKKLSRDKVEDIFRLDRIILYIDDLDRCDIETVIKVLQAIHLLLAFPLFVVVVGVDPRWMNNALNSHYGKLLNSVQSNGHDATYLMGAAKPATSYDYLEKIFQIPFALKTMTNDSKADLIRAQFERASATTGAPEPGKQVVDAPADDHPADNLPDDPPDDDPAGDDSTGDDTSGDDSPTDTPISDPVSETPPPLLDIGKEEIDFMAAIGFMIGDSPRTIKRYVNIYRIIRTHTRFKLQTGKEFEYYRAAMLLLAAITGTPDSARPFINEIRTSADSRTFSHFILHTEVKSKEPALARLYQIMTTAAFTPPQKLVFDAGRIRLKAFKDNLNLICRFSFRDFSDAV